MKTTLEIPDALFRRAKSAASERGIPFRELVSEALAERLRSARSGEKPWLKTFGKLRSLRRETARITRMIDREFGQVERAGFWMSTKIRPSDMLWPASMRFPYSAATGTSTLFRD